MRRFKKAAEECADHRSRGHARATEEAGGWFVGEIGSEVPRQKDWYGGQEGSKRSGGKGPGSLNAHVLEEDRAKGKA
jgi:hypothetical protein